MCLAYSQGLAFWCVHDSSATYTTLQAGKNFLDEWQNMRSMFVNDEFQKIADVKDSSNIFNKVRTCLSPNTQSWRGTLITSPVGKDLWCDKIIRREDAFASTKLTSQYNLAALYTTGTA